MSKYTLTLNPHFSCFSTSLWMFQLLNLRCLNFIMSLKWLGHLKVFFLIFKHYTKFWRTVFPKVLNTVFFYGSELTMFTNDHSLSKASVKKRLFIFRNIFVMPLWLMYWGFSYLRCLTFLTAEFHTVFLEIGRVEINIYLVVYSTENWLKTYSLHIPEEAGIMLVTSITEALLSCKSECPDFLKWAVLGAVRTCLPRELHATGNQLVMRLQSNTEAVSFHLRQSRPLKSTIRNAKVEMVSSLRK